MKFCKQLAKAALIRLVQCPPFTTWRRRRRRRRVTILLYHQIDAERFGDHLQWLLARYQLITPDRLAEACAGDWASLPDNPLLITFDDGWKSNFELANVLRARGARITIFLTAGLIDTRRRIWNYVLPVSAQKSDQDHRLRRLANCERLAELAARYHHTPTTEYDTRDMLDANEIQQLLDCVDFESHGMFHPNLTSCDDHELETELGESKRRIEELTGRHCVMLAYPYGSSSSRVEAAARRHGYLLGRLCLLAGLADASTDPMRLPAVGVFAEDDPSDLERAIAWAELRSLFPARPT